MPEDPYTKIEKDKEKTEIGFKFPYERRARSLSNPKHSEIQLKADCVNFRFADENKREIQKKSISPDVGSAVEKVQQRGPVIAKTDFTLQQ